MKKSTKRIGLFALIGALIAAGVWAWKNGKLPFLQKKKVTKPGTVLKNSENVTFEFDPNAKEGGNNILVNGRSYGYLSEMWLDKGVIYGIQPSGNKYMFNGVWTSI